MFVKLFEKHWKTHPIKLSFIAGVLFTVIALLIAYILFQNQPHLIGLTSIFFTVIFAMPVFAYLFKSEEKLEKTKTSFFKKNHAIIDYHLYFFFGVLLTFTIMSMYNSAFVFDLGDFFNVELTTSSISAPAPLLNESKMFFSILQNNVFLILLSFMLRFFFGSGGIFLIVLNGSIAGSLIASFAGPSPVASFCNVALFQIHFIPEMLGFLLAAIASGVMMADFLKERLWSRDFKKVGIDALILVGISLFFIMSAALLEVYVVKGLLQSSVCTTTPYIPLIGIFIGVVGIALLEHKRQRHKKAYLRTKGKISAFRK